MDDLILSNSGGGCTTCWLGYAQSYLCFFSSLYSCENKPDNWRIY